MAEKDDDILSEARERLALCVRLDNDNRQQAIEDFRFLAGEQWPAEMSRLREVEGRPKLTINKLPASVHQVVNDQRMNRPSIKVHPVDGGADVDTASVIQGMIKYIEYNSNADVCYDTSVAHASIGGVGYFRLGRDYESSDSFDQEIKFRRVQNPFTVYMDPFSTEPDGSDQRFCFVTEMMSRKEFERSYPKATTSGESLSVGSGDTATVWISDDSIRVAEYYRIKSVADTLYRLTDGRDVFKSQMQPGDVVATGEDGEKKERPSERSTVEWFKITGREVLERTEIPCKWIPVFPVYGDEHIVDGKIVRCGMIRFARDPQRMYNFWLTSATEEVSLRPKAPFIGAVGQFETAKKDWKQANKRSLPFVEYDPVEVGGNLAPPPHRSPMTDVPTGVLAMAMHASDNIKAVLGIFDASLGAQGNETSGRAITARQREGDVGNMHFADNLARTIRHAGRCIVDMIPKVYDTPRIVRILGDDEKMDMARVNTPTEPKIDPQTQAIRTVENDVTVGKYDVVIGTGPSYTTKRAEAVDAMMQVGQSFPEIWKVAGDKMVRAMDWPEADKIADRLEKMVPAELKEEEGDQPQQLPPEVQQVLEQASMRIEELQNALQEAQSGVAAKQLETESRERIAAAQEETKRYVADANNEVKHDIAELSGMVQILIQNMQPPPQLATEVGQDLAKNDSDSQPLAGATA